MRGNEPWNIVWRNRYPSARKLCIKPGKSNEELLWNGRVQNWFPIWSRVMSRPRVPFYEWRPECSTVRSCPRAFHPRKNRDAACRRGRERIHTKKGNGRRCIWKSGFLNRKSFSMEYRLTILWILTVHTGILINVYSRDTVPLAISKPSSGWSLTVWVTSGLALCCINFADSIFCCSNIEMLYYSVTRKRQWVTHVFLRLL